MIIIELRPGFYISIVDIIEKIGYYKFKDGLAR